MAMDRQVVHFEIIGRDPAVLRRYYGDLLGWTFETGDAASDEVSEPGNYGFVDGATTGGINGGVGGGRAHAAQVLFYVRVPDVEAALREAERLGGTRELGPEGTPGELVIGRFSDPEGNLIGVAGVQ
jgi:uncharacterized protein